ncbi:MAG TPA: hypothetical protein VFI38_08970 [Candidatus Acidoferrum sp.]|nr:hypothetical protein [Candidatus Acidoferrum sp.]
MNKTITTLNLPAPSKADGAKQAQWEELRSVFPIYVALAKQLQLEIPIAQNKRILPEKLDPDLFNQIQKWLDVMDQQVLVHQLRHLLQMTTLNASESGLRALIMRHLRKPSKTTTDRDKADFLLVQYFALTAPPKIYHKQIELGDVANVLRPVFGEVDSTPLPWCEPLENMIHALRGFKSLRDMLQTNFIEQGRRVKETAGGMFYDPSAMLAFIRFNFLMRRTLIELMHADLIFIRSGLSSLQHGGARAIDCNSVGLGKGEPIEKLQQMTDEWKQPFQKEYTERTVNQAFEKLLGLRADVERAVEKVLGKPPAPPVVPEPEAVGKKILPNATAVGSSSKAKEKPDAGPAKQSESAGTALDFETCMEQIWEQLISAPPSRGRSMTTVKLGTVRLLMSSWEVAAFVSEDGPAAEDLRRAVVARALLTSNLEHAKETGNATGLDRALTIARVEVSRLQERVEAAKQAKDTEAAVNLGISTKRLLSALDEAEKL